jgi:hypothetical protein
MGFAGYPTLRLMTPAETGTRGLLGAAPGSAADRDEPTVARRLLSLLRPGMLVLLDRAFDGNAFLREVAATGAMLVARAKPPGTLSSWVICRTALTCRTWTGWPSGSSRRCVTVTGADGSWVRGSYRLITTLIDHHRVPAAAVVRLCAAAPCRPDRPRGRRHALPPPSAAGRRRADAGPGPRRVPDLAGRPPRWPGAPRSRCRGRRGRP